MLSVEEIRTFIENDTSSEKKRYAKIAERYYEADHDIKDYRMFFVDANGRLKEDKYRSNIRIAHPFFTEIVDQVVQFELSNEEGFLRSDIPELQKELDYYFNSNEEFRANFEPWSRVLTTCTPTRTRTAELPSSMLTAWV